MKQGLLNILRDIFSSSGYNVTESYRYDMVAEKNGYKTLIKFGTYPDYSDIKHFADQVTDGTGLYVATHEISDDLCQYAIESGLMVWNRDDVALQIGKAVLADIEGTTADLELIPLINRQPLAQTMNTGFVAEKDNSIFGMFGQRDTPEKMPAPPEPMVAPLPPQQQQQWGGMFSQPEAVRSPPAQPKQSMVLDLHTVPLNISKEHAIGIAKQHVGIVNDVILKFVPFWTYRYSINIEQQYKSKIIDISGDGNGCLNALNGHDETLEFKEVCESVEVQDDGYEIKGPILTRDEANRSLLDKIIDEHTEEVRFDSMAGDTIISEHKLFKPNDDDIDLELEIVYVPIWELKGRNNSVEISAHDSKILCNPVDDDVEFI